MLLRDWITLSMGKMYPALWENCHPAIEQREIPDNGHLNEESINGGSSFAMSGAGSRILVVSAPESQAIT